MKNQKGLGLIGILLIIGAFFLTAGGVVVWRDRSSPHPTPTLIPTPIPSSILTPTPSPTLPETTPIACQTSADCPPSLGVCISGKCPTWRCRDGHCIYFEDAKVLDSCLKEAENARKRVCEESGAHLDEYGNCVGVDFVKDPYRECYDKYGQK